MSGNGPSTDKPQGHSPRKRPSLLVLAGGAVVFVVAALALGLGLGLGLRSERGTSSSSSSSPGPTATTAPLPGATGNGTTLEDWRLDTSQYLLNMTWDVNASPTTRRYDFVISEIQGWPDGVVRPMLVINGKFPGPVIEVNRGDRLVVNVTNTLVNATAIHWHGLYQNGTNWFDGTTGITQCGIPPGQSLLYNFTIDNQFGTYWYHSHYSTQYLDGIIGPLIIHAPEEAETRNLYDQDQIVMVQDWYHDFSTVNLANYLVPDNENSEPLPDNGLINGRAYFNCSLYGDDDPYTCYQNSSYTVFNYEPNVRTRFRLINSGAFAEFEFSVDNHSLSVIEADGTLVNPQAIHRLPIHVAQRYSVILNTNRSTSTNYWIRASMITLCFTGTNPVLDSDTKAVLSYSGNGTLTPSNASVDWADAYSVQCVDLDESELVPSTQIVPPPATKMYRVDFSFGEGAYQLDYAKINGTTWSPLKNTTTLIEAVNGMDSGNVSQWGVDGQVGTFQSNQFVVGLSASGVEVVDILIYSLDEGAHPFHFHGHSFWILETGAGIFNWTYYYDSLMPSKPEVVGNALRRDTLTVQSYSWSLIRVVADNPGLWALHCHIAWHMEAGLLMQFMSRADILKTMVVPDDVKALCAAS